MDFFRKQNKGEHTMLALYVVYDPHTQNKIHCVHLNIDKYTMSARVYFDRREQRKKNKIICFAIQAQNGHLYFY